ncbi:hypothetical protein KCP69_16015 [Salmonella enterica subsp. enterica]|nr:hypothetical protein KCP69_16015 [Salmonella enterica subsp. enterica]
MGILGMPPFTAYMGVTGYRPAERGRNAGCRRRHRPRRRNGWANWQAEGPLGRGIVGGAKNAVMRQTFWI